MQKIENLSPQRSKRYIHNVADIGVGIPEPIKRKMITPMFTTKLRIRVSVCQLSIVLTEALDGTVSFESQEFK